MLAHRGHIICHYSRNRAATSTRQAKLAQGMRKQTIYTVTLGLLSPSEDLDTTAEFHKLVMAFAPHIQNSAGYSELQTNLASRRQVG